MAVGKVAEVFPPGEFIREELEARDWSQNDLADIIGRHPNVVSELILGKRSITTDTANALATAFGTSAQFWMNLQITYQLGKTAASDNEIARRAKLYEFAPLKEMIKRRWIEESKNLEILETELMRFFDITDLDQAPVMPCAARKSTPYTSVSASERAWLFRAKHLARAIHAVDFTRPALQRALSELRPLMANAQDVRHVPKILAGNGIRFLIIEHLPRTRIDGVTFWLDSKSPVVALSLRYDRIDSFWYTLCHELAHVRSADGLGDHGCILDTDLVGDERTQSQNRGERPEEEEQADGFAQEFLVTPAELNDFIQRTRPLYSKVKIRGFAKRIRVHPGIVVGQLQHRNEVNWSYYRVMLEKIRDAITASALTDGWGHTVRLS